MYIKNVDALEQLRDLVIGIKELPYIKRVAIHGSSLIKENINDIDLVIIFNNEFDFENGGQLHFLPKFTHPSSHSFLNRSSSI